MAPTAPPSSSPPARVGRPRDPHAEQAILQATVDLVAEVGLSGLTVDAVASRAGVGKATIYRRWSSKESLVFEAVATLADDPPSPDTGSVRADLLELFTPTAERFADERTGRLLVEMAAAAVQDSALRDVQRDLVERRRQNGRTILRRAVDRGEIPVGVDVDLVLDLVIGPAAYRCFLSHRVIDREMVESSIDLVLAGLGAGGGAPAG